MIVVAAVLALGLALLLAAFLLTREWHYLPDEIEEFLRNGDWQ